MSYHYYCKLSSTSINDIEIFLLLRIFLIKRNFKYLQSRNYRNYYTYYVKPINLCLK